MTNLFNERIVPGDLVSPRRDMDIVLWPEYEIQTFDGHSGVVLSGAPARFINTHSIVLVVAIFDPIEDSDTIVTLYDSMSCSVGYSRLMFLLRVATDGL